MAYKSLADIHKPQEEEPIMSEMSSIQKNRLADIPPAQPESQVPMIPNETPQEQVFTEPKLEDILPVKSETPMLALQKLLLLQCQSQRLCSQNTIN